MTRIQNSTQPEPPLLDPAYAALVTNHQRALFGYVMTLMDRPSEADDVLQQVNLVLCQKAHEYDPLRPFLPWACGIAYYEVLAYRKRRQRDRHTYLEGNLLQELAGEALHHAEHLEARLQSLRQCLEKLPRRSRELLAERYEQQASVQSMAQKQNRTVGAISAALHRVRRALLDCIQSITRESRER